MARKHLPYTIQTGSENAILRKISDPVEKITPEIKAFCDDLLDLMRDNDGVGLAAPQVGKNIRIVATTQRDSKKEKLLGETIMINPIIKEASQEMITRDEACISLPDIFGKVKRHKIIIVEFLDLKGKKQTKKLKDFNAVIVQHELDHLNGILFTDKLIKGKK